MQNALFFGTSDVEERLENCGMEKGLFRHQKCQFFIIVFLSDQIKIDIFTSCRKKKFEGEIFSQTFR